MLSGGGDLGDCVRLAERHVQRLPDFEQIGRIVFERNVVKRLHHVRHERQQHRVIRNVRHMGCVTLRFQPGDQLQQSPGGR